jgi:hypothetical protein
MKFLALYWGTTACGSSAMPDQSDKKRNVPTGTGIALGTSLGVAFGALYGQLAFGLALGVAFGAAIDVVSHVRHKNKD